MARRFHGRYASNLSLLRSSLIIFSSHLRPRKRSQTNELFIDHTIRHRIQGTSSGPLLHQRSWSCLRSMEIIFRYAGRFHRVCDRERRRFILGFARWHCRPKACHRRAFAAVLHQDGREAFGWCKNWHQRHLQYDLSAPRRLWSLSMD